MTANQPAETTRVSSPPPEPWLRGTLTDIAAVPRAVLHALELAGEDLHKWCGSLTEAELNARPAVCLRSRFISATSREASIVC